MAYLLAMPLHPFKAFLSLGKWEKLAVKFVTNRNADLAIFLHQIHIDSSVPNQQTHHPVGDIQGGCHHCCSRDVGRELGPDPLIPSSKGAQICSFFESLSTSEIVSQI